MYSVHALIPESQAAFLSIHCHSPSLQRPCDILVLSRPSPGNPLSMATVMDDVRKIPPVTRFLCGALVTITLSVKLDAVSFYSVAFIRKLVTNEGQVSLLDLVSVVSFVGCLTP